MKYLLKRAFVFLVVFFLLLPACLSQASGLKMRIFTVHHRNAQLLYSVVKDIVSSDGRVSFDANTNKIIVVDHPENLALAVG